MSGPTIAEVIVENPVVEVTVPCTPSIEVIQRFNFTNDLTNYALISYVNNISGILAGQIGSGGVTNLNTLFGAINIRGGSGIGVVINGQDIFLNYTGAQSAGDFYLNSNPSGFLNSLSGLSTGYVLQITNSLQAQINGLPYLTTGNADNRYLLLGQTGQFASSGNLYSTGFLLDTKINSLSGYSNSIFSTIINLQATGSNLQNQLTILFNWTGTTPNLFYPLSSNPSGYLTSISLLNYATVSNLQATGSSLQAQINALPYLTTGNADLRYLQVSQTGQFAASGNLYSTGSLLDNKINSLSGYSNSIFATAINLQTTGNSLYGYIVGLSGAANSIYATITNLQLTGANLQSQINQVNSWTGITPTIFYPLGMNPSGYLVASSLSSYATVANLQLTGANLQNQINALPYLTTGNADSRYLLLSQTGQFASSGNLYSSGSILDNKINSLSGYGSSTFSTILSLQLTGSNLQSQILQINNWTGITNSLFYPLSGNPSGYLTSNSLIPYATVANLQTTGSNLYQSIFSLSGYSNSVFATISNLQLTGSNLQSQINALPYLTTGNADNRYLLLSQTGQFASSGNLLQTGINLGARIDSLSGYSNSVFATISNLQLTGSNLQSQLTTLFNWTGITPNLFYPLSGNPSGYIHAVELNAASGVLQSQITNLGNNDVTGISINGGSSLTGRINFNSVGSVTLSSIGNTITISGSGIGGASSVNIFNGSGTLVSGTNPLFSINVVFDTDQAILANQIFN